MVHQLTERGALELDLHAVRQEIARLTLRRDQAQAEERPAIDARLAPLWERYERIYVQLGDVDR